jgi:hypothetical protein
MAALTVFIIAACEQDDTGVRGIVERNIPPETWLERVEIDSLTHDFEYRIHFYWGGRDVDGHVSHYEYKQTNGLTGCCSWLSIYRTDSTFVFIREPKNDVCLHDTLWVRAVDDEGARDISPVFYPAPRYCP